MTNKLIEYLKNNLQDYNPNNKEDLQGWMDINVMKIFDMLDKKKNIFMIEVGTWKGRSAISFAKNLAENNGQILCIDTWLGAPEFYTWGLEDSGRGKSLKHKYGFPTVYYTFLDNVYLNNLQNTIIPFPISSDQGASILNYYEILADAIYIDASHEEGHVFNDISNYWKLLKPGGVLFGDDFTNGWMGVVNDVIKFCNINNIQPLVYGVVWFIKKPI